MEWYELANIGEIDSPALVIHPDRVQQNIDYAIRQVGDPDRLRPHVKTHKMVEVARMQLDAGISKFKCATIAEAEMLAQAGAQDVLIAYQVQGPKLSRLIALINKYPEVRFASLVDNLSTLEEVDHAFAKGGRKARLYIDMDVGQHRTGIEPGTGVERIIRQGKVHSNVDMAGLHVYDGHIRDSDFDIRKKRSDRAFSPIQPLADFTKAELGHEVEIVAGGSPTFKVHALRKKHVICSPGTFVFWDVGYKTMLPESEFQWAAVLISRVISRMSPTRICVDLGHKSVAAENPFPRVHFLNLPNAKQIGQSEEHLVLEISENDAAQVGDILYGIPLHICPTVALYNSVYVAKENRVVDIWSVTARGRKISI